MHGDDDEVRAGQRGARRGTVVADVGGRGRSQKPDGPLLPLGEVWGSGVATQGPS